MKLHFDHAAISRSTTRAQWRKIWQWKRVTEKALRHTEEQMRINLSVHGSVMPPKMRAEILDRLVNPPLVLFP